MLVITLLQKDSKKVRMEFSKEGMEMSGFQKVINQNKIEIQFGSNIVIVQRLNEWDD